MPRPTTPTGESLSVRDVAAALSVSKSTVYRLIDSDDLLGFRVGRSIRIPLKAYQMYRRELGLD